jgi:glycosyltransferase involved in cell wall biosynthesis
MNSSENRPLVSVLVRFYNQEKFIEECVYSVLNQDYQNLQIIIIDDCSTDGTAQIIRSLEKENPKIIEAIFNSENLGELETFNRAYQNLRGEYFTMLDGDDIYFPGKISMQVDYLGKNSNCGACYHDAFVFLDDVSNRIFRWSERFICKSGSSKVVARYGHFPVSNAIMMRREFMPAIGHDSRVKTQGDWLLLLDVIERSGKTFDYIDEVYSGYRKHSGTISVSGDWEEKLESRYTTISIAKQKYPHLKSDLMKYHAELLFIEFLLFIKSKKIFRAIKSLLLSLTLAFPNVFILLRIPLRELKFLIKQGGKFDPYIQGFFQ